MTLIGIELTDEVECGTITDEVVLAIEVARFVFKFQCDIHLSLFLSCALGFPVIPYQRVVGL